MGGYSFGDASNSDAWLVKYDVNGNREWIQFFRGAAHEQLNKIIQTDVNEFVFVGATDSSGEGFNDVWFVKTNEQGKRVWDHTYGGSGYDTAYDVIQTSDGFAIIGATSSFGAGNFDAWLVKTDFAGNVQWNQTYGRSTYNSAYSGIQTVDGGYLLAGITKTFRTFTDDMDLWLLKLDASGQLQWNQTYGGDQDDEAYSIIQTTDNGFAIAGHTRSYNATRWDAWLIKTDSFGVVPDIEVHRFSRFEIVLMVGLTIIAIGSFVYYVKHWRSRRSRWRKNKTKSIAEGSIGIIRRLPHEDRSSEISQKPSSLDFQKDKERR